MELKGKQKAAMLLMSLDTVTAAELLKGVDNKVLQELAIELEHLDATGLQDSKQNAEIARQFCDSLRPKEIFCFKGFFNTVLKNTLGDEKAEQIQTQIQNFLKKKDPITSISLALDFRSLDKDIRNGLLASVREKDSNAADIIAGLMIFWGDIPLVSDRTIRKALRRIGTKELALSLVGCEDSTIEKIKNNISRWTIGRLEKKASVISNASTDDIEKARKHIVNILRDMNIKGELSFVDDDATYIHNRNGLEEIIPSNSVKDQVIGIDG
ncbi:MAG: hypothetical protein FVQ79_10765 [Planctomycetes bacterium]|nr:hypothetical protein [Planctomycetota bacterium]